MSMLIVPLPSFPMVLSTVVGLAPGRNDLKVTVA
jgi:hypothetical protein